MSMLVPCTIALLELPALLALGKVDSASRRDSFVLLLLDKVAKDVKSGLERSE